jgi:hypothetical protein
MRGCIFGVAGRSLRRALGAGCIFSAALGGSATACRVPREVHEPVAYPAIKIASRAMQVDVVDSRPPAATPSERRLVLPADFEQKARRRLGSMLSGQGPAVRVRVQLGAADEIPLLDARGEMTRVLVTLDFEVMAADGTLLRTAQSQSSSDLPREEATPEEVDFVLAATALDAFDRYWANPTLLQRLNGDLSAYAQKHPSSDVLPRP